MYLVDAGEILRNVRAVSPRDSVHLALAELGDRAQFPITVTDNVTGDEFLFVLPETVAAVPDPGPPSPGKKRPKRAEATAKKVRA